MNLDHQRFFFLSGLITFLLVGVLFFLFVWKFFMTATPATYALTQSDVISVSLDVTTPSTHHVKTQPQPSAPTDSPTPMESTNSKAPLTEEAPVVPEISDLFSTIKPAKKIQKPKENTKQLSDLNALEEKVLTTKRDSQLFDKVKTLDLAKPGAKAAASSTGPVVNEYNAKIQGIIHSNFHPASGTEGFSARVRITLSPDGKLLAYRVISYSGNAIFNADVDFLKERLRQVGFPSHPYGEEAVFEIILRAKE